MGAKHVDLGTFGDPRERECLRALGRHGRLIPLAHKAAIPDRRLPRDTAGPELLPEVSTPCGTTGNRHAGMVGEDGHC